MNRSRASRLSVFGIITALTAGCEKRLEAPEFLARYERECVISIQSGSFQFILLYESPEFIAISTAGTDAPGKVLDSLSRTYSNAHYIRLSIRPVSRPGDEIPGVMEAKNYSLDRLLRTVPGGLAGKIHLDGPEGKTVKPIAVSQLSGMSSGSTNTIVIVFAAGDIGQGFKPDKWQLVVDDFGLNLGTFRSRLAEAKGFRLKVAS